MVMMEYLEVVILPSLVAMISLSVLTRGLPHLWQWHVQPVPLSPHLYDQLSLSLMELDKYNWKSLIFQKHIRFHQSLAEF